MAPATLESHESATATPILDLTGQLSELVTDNFLDWWRVQLHEFRARTCESTQRAETDFLLLPPCWPAPRRCSLHKPSKSPDSSQEIVIDHS